MIRPPLAASALSALVAACLVTAALPARSEGRTEMPARPYKEPVPGKAANHETYNSQEILQTGHKFFGKTTNGFGQAVEYVFQKYGRPQGYIIGQEGAGAFVGGLRYGEGMLYLKNGQNRKVYWQGPSLGFDFGGNGSRTLVLVYNIDDTNDIFDRFLGVDGSAYLVGGFGINYQSNEKLSLAPIRTGVGARLGANIGYLKYTARPTWNPF